MMAGGGTASRQTQPYVPTSMGHGRGNPAASGGQIAAAAAAAAAIQEQQVGGDFRFFLCLQLYLFRNGISISRKKIVFLFREIVEFQFHEKKFFREIEICLHFFFIFSQVLQAQHQQQLHHHHQQQQQQWQTYSNFVCLHFPHLLLIFQ
jgi:hypothetical protein